MKREIILRWIKKAENDIKVAKHLLEAEEIITDIICFHCQQAVEKYLKAYLTYYDIRAKKTHDLENILALCINQDEDFRQLDKVKISNMTYYATEIRYAEKFYIPSIEEAKESYETAIEVKNFVLRKLNIQEEELKE